jgi:hypothetical protein
MKAIREAAGQDLQWIRTKRWKREFALRSGDEVLAMLSREKRTGRAIGEAADGRWAFKRRTFYSPCLIQCTGFPICLKPGSHAPADSP